MARDVDLEIPVVRKEQQEQTEKEKPIEKKAPKKEDPYDQFHIGRLPS